MANIKILILKLYHEIIKNGEFIVDTKKSEHMSLG